MKKYILSFFCLFTCLFLVAQEDYPNTLLWEISGNGLEKPSYLYGTMHVQDDRAFRFGDSVMVKFESVDAIALEIVDDMFTDPSKMDMSLMSEIMMEGDVLEDLISPKDFKQVKKLFGESLENMMPEDQGGGFMLKMMSGFMVNRIKPMFTATLISTRNANMDHALPLDSYLMEKGQEMGKEMIGIETAQEQMEAINRIPNEEQAQMLVEMLEDMDAADLEMDKMIDAYEKQDLNTILEMITGMGGDAFEDELLVKRNNNMAERIDTIIQNRSTFAAVGTAHLIGKTGLITQMKELGYTVRPIISKYTPPIKESELDKLFGLMIGSYDSSEQAKEDSNYDNVSLEMHPIWTGDESVKWIYVEQAVSTMKDKPYRQRVYKLVELDDDQIASYVYTLPNEKDYIGKWENEELFSKLKPSDLIDSEGCEVILKRAGDAYAGSTGDKSCQSEFKGASYEKSKMTISKIGIISWDQGFDDKDKQVWGAKKGGYIFLKK